MSELKYLAAPSVEEKIIIAKEKRPNAAPPLTLQLTGTVF